MPFRICRGSSFRRPVQGFAGGSSGSSRCHCWSVKSPRLMALRWEFRPETSAVCRHGLAAARTRGKRGGRRPNLKPQDIAMVRKLYEDKQTPIEDICRMFKISRMTLWRYMKKAGDKLQQQN